MRKTFNPWKTLGTRIAYQSPWFTLREDSVIAPNGDQRTYTYPDNLPFAMAIAHDGDDIILIRQYRYPLRRVMVEFPGGGVDEGETPLAAAKRELQEETGLIAKRWTEIGTLNNHPTLGTIFLAQEISDSGKDKMADEGIENYVRVTPAEIDAMIASGQITDAQTLAALLLYERHFSQDE